MLDGSGDDIDQPGSVEGRDEKECDAVGSASDEDGGPYLEHCAEACEGPDEPEGNEKQKGARIRPMTRPRRTGIETGDAVEGDDGDAESSEGDRRSIGEQARPAASSGAKPRPMRMVPQTATGVPKPAAPSKKAPKQRR